MVMLIIGILLTFAFPIATQLREKSYKAQAISALRSIANAYRQYMIDYGHPIRWSDLSAINCNASYDVSLIAAELARTGYLKDIDAWIWDFDYKVRKYKSQGNTVPKMFNGDKINSSFRGQSGVPFSVIAMLAGNSFNSDDFLDYASDIPVACTRGLSENRNKGQWVDKSVNYNLGSVFGSKGGFVAYLDGHVVWYDNLGTSNDGKIKKYAQDEFSNNIADGLPKGTHSGFTTSNSTYLAGNGGGGDCLDW